MIVISDVVFSSANTCNLPIFSEDAILAFFKGQSALHPMVINGTPTNVAKLCIENHLSENAAKYRDILDSNDCGMLECGNRLVEKVKNRSIDKDFSDTSILVTSAYQFHEKVHTHAHTHKQSKKQILQQLISSGSVLATMIKSHGMVVNMSSTCSSLSSTMSIGEDIMNSNKTDTIIVLSGDNTTTDTMLSHYHQGFHNIGAIKATHDCNQPFNGANGLKLGAGCGAMMLSNVTELNPNDVQLVHSKSRNLGKKTLGLDDEFNQTSFVSFMNMCFEKLKVDEIKASSMLYIGHDTGTVSCTTCEFNMLQNFFCTQDNNFADLTLMSCKHILGHTMGHNQEHYYGIYLLKHYKTIIENGLSVLYDGNKNNHSSEDKDALLNIMNNIEYLCVGSFGMSGNVCFTMYRLVR